MVPKYVHGKFDKIVEFIPGKNEKKMCFKRNGFWVKPVIFLIWYVAYVEQ